MTGPSIPTSENWNRLKPYYLSLLSGAMIAGGAVLMIEHVITYDGFDLFDIAGHETYGLALIVGGYIVAMKWGQWRELKLWKLKNWWR